MIKKIDLTKVTQNEEIQIVVTKVALYYFCAEYWKSATQDPGPLGRTRDQGPHKWDPGPQYDHMGPKTRDTLIGTWDSKIFKWDPGPGTPEVGG